MNSYAQVVDIGFIIAVMAVCFQVLFGASDSLHRKTKRWKDELRYLEDTLRTLIAEAGATGNNLNRNLVKRKEELTALLQQIEEAKLNELADRETRAARPAPRRQPPVEDLPNESWAPKAAPRKSEASLPDEQGDYLELQALATPDEVTISTQVRRAPVAQASAAQAKPSKPTSTKIVSELAKQIEISRKRENESHPRGFSGASADQTVYRIAERLLRSGKEIHVVARKLEIPLSEVRLIESQIRSEDGIPMEEPVAVVRAPQDAVLVSNSNSGLTNEFAEEQFSDVGALNGSAITRSTQLV